MQDNQVNYNCSLNVIFATGPLLIDGVHSLQTSGYILLGTSLRFHEVM
jgi:hypothetical protein